MTTIMPQDDDDVVTFADGIAYGKQVGDHQPMATCTAREAVAHARELCKSGVYMYPRLCLRHVREDWRLPAKYETAIDAWSHAHNRIKYNGAILDKWEKSIPFGAPVFSTNGSDAGHVFIAGGYFQHGPAEGRRIFRSNDVRKLGVINAVTLDFFPERWGHTILGWTHDLNGYYLPLDS